LLDINEFRVAKAKGRFVEARNKKGTITKAKKTKAKSIKRDLFDFEHVDAAIKVSRDNKGAIERGDRRDKVRLRKQKKPKVSIVAAMNANIKAFNEKMKKIHEDMRSIITRQTTKKATKKTKNDLRNLCNLYDH